MKKTISLVLILSMLMSLFTFVSPVFAADDIKVTINGQALTMDQPPVLVNDRTLVPVRAIFEALGAKVDWNNDTNTATGVLGGTTVEIQIENTVAKVNGKDVTLDVPAKLISDRTLVPVRFISESLGAKVDWDDPSQTVIITTSPSEKVITFDNLDKLVENTDYQLGGAMPPSGVSLSAEKDHTSGSGKSLKLSGRKATANRIKFMNDFGPQTGASEFTYSAYVLTTIDTKVRMGTYSVTGGGYSTTALEAYEFSVKANEWTLISAKFKYSNEASLVGIDQAPLNPLADVIYIDDITIKSVSGDISQSATTPGTLTFDNLNEFVENKDYQLGGAMPQSGVSLSTEKDHTTGSGKSLKMSERTASSNRVKIMNLIPDSLLGKTLNASVWVYTPNDTKIRVGTYSVTGGAFSTAAKASVNADVKKDTWTNVVLTFVHDSADANMIGIDEVSVSSASPIIYVDDISVSEAKEVEFESLLNPDGTRKVPDKFEKSSDLHDLIYYEAPKDPDAMIAALPEGTKVLGFDDIAKATLMGGNKFGTSELVNLTGEKFDKAYRVNVTTLPEFPYNFQFQMKIPDGTFEIGDVVFCKLTMRTTAGGVPESKMGQVQYNMESYELSGNPKVLIGDAIASSDWVTTYAATTIDKNFLKSVQADIRLGYYIQTVEIAEYEIINFKNTVKLTDIPSTATYPGQEKDAEWRKEALDRIEKIRKGDVKVIVKDANGNVIPDAKVDVNMYEHTFKWGTAVNGNIYKISKDGDKYRENLVKYFNSAVLENNHKWKALDETPDQAWKDVKWLNDNGLSVRGHTLVWPSFNSVYAVPDYVRDAVSAGDKAKFDEYIKNHIQKTLTEWKGSLTDWDLTNELVHNTNFVDAFGESIYLDWMKWANEADPDTPMYLSETAIIGTDDKTLNKYIDILKYLNENNAPYDGIAIHAHMASLVDPMKFYNQLQKILEVSPDKGMQITEFDVRARDVYSGAEFVRDIIIACFSIEQMEGFCCWGFWDNAHWFNNAPLFDKDWNLKPSGQQYEDLVYNKFWTRDSGTSNANGEYDLRAFYGLYNITATKDGQSKTIKTEIKKGADNTFVITLD